MTDAQLAGQPSLREIGTLTRAALSWSLSACVDWKVSIRGRDWTVGRPQRRVRYAIVRQEVDPVHFQSRRRMGSAHKEVTNCKVVAGGNRIGYPIQSPSTRTW